jgi:hypothetical protein
MVSSVSFPTVMLAFSRRSACRRYLFRELSTTTEFSSTTKNISSPGPFPLDASPALSNGTLFVRTWDGIPSIAHALAIIRGLESRYGKVREFRFGRVRCSLHLFHNSGLTENLGCRSGRSLRPIFLGRPGNTVQVYRGRRVSGPGSRH